MFMYFVLRVCFSRVDGSFRQNSCRNGTRTRMGHCILCQTFTLQLMWELKWVLYFGILSVPVPVLFPHKFCLKCFFST